MRRATLLILALAVVAGGVLVATRGSRAPSGVVTGGSGSDVPRQVGAPTPAGVVCTRSLKPGANVQRVLSSVSAGSVVCLNAGSWPALTLTSIAPASCCVTLAAAPGQTVVVPGFTITGADTRNLTLEGFDITVPGNSGGSEGGNSATGIQLVGGISGGVTLQYNTIENQPNGTAIYAYANGHGGGGYAQSGVTIAYNQIDHAGTGVEVDGGIAQEANFTISHNVIGPYILYQGYGHYIQVQGISGLAVDHNAFEGPVDPAYWNSTAHDNVLHVDTGQRNVTFDNNVMWHTQNLGNATVLIQDHPLDIVTMENNLDVEDPGCETKASCYTAPVDVEAPHGLEFEHNTFVNAALGITLGNIERGTYTDPQNMTAEYNIAVSVSGDGGGTDYGSWTCSSACTAADNVSADTSANAVLGGTHNVVSWTPAWRTTSWTPVSGPGYQPPPSGYYQPTGLAVSSAGYQGNIGP